MNVKDMKFSHWVIVIVLLALFIWGIVWLSGPLTVDDVMVPDVEDLMPGWEK